MVLHSICMFRSAGSFKKLLGILIQVVQSRAWASISFQSFLTELLHVHLEFRNNDINLLAGSCGPANTMEGYDIPLSNRICSNWSPSIWEGGVYWKHCLYRHPHLQGKACDILLSSPFENLDQWFLTLAHTQGHLTYDKCDIAVQQGRMVFSISGVGQLGYPYKKKS